jgi:hypothetical protein
MSRWSPRIHVRLGRIGLSSRRPAGEKRAGGAVQPFVPPFRAGRVFVIGFTRQSGIETVPASGATRADGAFANHGASGLSMRLRFPLSRGREAHGLRASLRGHVAASICAYLQFALIADTFCGYE